MSEKELVILGCTSLFFGAAFLALNCPWVALPLMAVGFVCFFTLSTRPKDGGGPPGPIQPA